MRAIGGGVVFCRGTLKAENPGSRSLFFEGISKPIAGRLSRQRAAEPKIFIKFDSLVCKADFHDTEGFEGG